MDEKDWLILVTLDKERNITKAAEQLFISQPALSYRIQQIEAYFNSRLFVRKRTGIRLTPQGEVIVEYAKEMQKRLSDVREMIQFMDTDVKGTIKIGVASTFGQYIMPELLRQFLKIYPDVNVNIITGLSTDIYQVLQDGDIHIAIIRGQHQWEEEKFLMATEPICAVAKTPITIQELPHKPRILYEIDPYLKSLIDQWWKDTFDKVGRTTMSVDSLETCKELVRTGLGYTILPGICLMDETDLYIRQLQLANGDKVLRRTWAYCREDSLKFATVDAFFQFLSAYRKQLPNLAASFSNE